MVTTSSPDLWTIHFIPRTYKEEIEGKGTEPKRRWLNFVLSSLNYKWHIKLIFQGKLQSAQNNTFAKVTKLRKDLENLCLCINFESVQLLDDTVTELLLLYEQDTHCQKLCLKTSPDIESEYAIINDLWFHIQEDPYRVRFPKYDSGSSCVPIKDLAAIKKIKEFGMGVHLVHVDSDEYVYKEIDRPLYIPRDSEVLEQELRNLELIYANEGFVRLAADVVSDNPYRTTPVTETNHPTSLQGILLEYYPNGILQNALKSPKPNYPWHRWALQITRALDALHQNGITHMDQPRNIVLSKNNDAILIDLSGIGGTTRKWLLPEMISLSEPLSQDFKARKQNDIWTLGLILFAMAHATCNAIEREVLSKVSILAATEFLPRISLENAISLLSSSLSALDDSELAPVNAVRIKTTIGAAT